MKSNVSRYRSSIFKSADRACKEGKIRVGHWPVAAAQSVRFVTRGRFTECQIRFKMYSPVEGRTPYSLTGIGFAHRVWGDKPNPEIGRLVALSRAVKDALAIELRAIREMENSNVNV